MSHIRLEAEDLAISLMPHQIRRKVRNHFTKGVGLLVQKALFPMHRWRTLLSQPRIAETKGISGKSTQSAIDSLTSLGWKHLEDSARGHDTTEWKFGDYKSDWHKALSEIATLTKKRKLHFAQSMPETTYIRVKRSGKEDLAFSLIADRSYSAHNLMQLEDLSRDPHNDAISVYRGFVGAFPNVFLDLTEDDLNNFIAEIKRMPINSTRYPWLKTFEKYAVKRTSADFWPYYDWIHRWKATRRPGNDPIAQGIVDLGHYAFF